MTALGPVADDWKPVVDGFLAGAVGQKLQALLVARHAAGATIYPPEPLRALRLTPLHAVRAVILGQDPYHGTGQAEGLAFSVAPGVRPPPSLRNIFKELQRDLGQPLPASGSLLPWAERGVLLLNTSLTVEEGRPASHAKQGWESLTDALIAHVAAHASPCAYLLWGAHAQAKAPLIARTAQDQGRQALVLQANHPSPLAALRPPVPFIGCGHFGQAQRWLAGQGQDLDWRLPAAI
ncbi:uracil-DNA glycosylase [Pseudorhodoferax sp. Leaf267]|uniref:uracil-DNA glycosylase n=1 Tax=Pseudorhodoferax sp. Leaf267 TaxID=1736316 RepID=UPI0006FFDB21|nr:uracil-DNA glycosylase [Pseudorhodoferax sp. Leaf267]KQP17176.1 uracil-DNA glycosylase [Pseudorhodoferax sp. Leaf267]